MFRRNFLQKTALASLGSLFVPYFLKAAERIIQPNDFKGKRLIIIQLSGGNDGLNTLVPFQNDIYYKSRPTIAIPKNEVLKLDNDLGFNPVLKPLQPLYNEGFMTILNNVGYPNPDRSHFRSMDIWHTGSGANEYLSTGWLGRYLDNNFGNNPTAHAALELDDTLSLALKGTNHNGFAMTDAQRLQRAVNTPIVKNISKSHHDHPHESNVAYLYQTLVNTSSSAAYLLEKSKTKTTTTEYPQHNFGKDLKQVAELVAGGCDTQIYYVSLGGFDTHANQKVQQERLLGIYAEAVAALVKDLKTNGQWENTLIMTFSEFGRRVAENGSKGTDHGTANQVYLLSGSLKKKGMFNKAPNLINLDEGDLIHELDFRKIYATILQDWLKCSSDAVLGHTFESLNII